MTHTQYRAFTQQSNRPGAAVAATPDKQRKCSRLTPFQVHILQCNAMQCNAMQCNAMQCKREGTPYTKENLSSSGCGDMVQDPTNS
eukprot:scaffold170949_cov75-Cyclotella_meneghiniana.AAC.1